MYDLHTALLKKVYDTPEYIAVQEEMKTPSKDIHKLTVDCTRSFQKSVKALSKATGKPMIFYALNYFKTETVYPTKTDSEALSKTKHKQVSNTELLVKLLNSFKTNSSQLNNIAQEWHFSTESENLKTYNVLYNLLMEIDDLAGAVKKIAGNWKFVDNRKSLANQIRKSIKHHTSDYDSKFVFDIPKNVFRAIKLFSKTYKVPVRNIIIFGIQDTTILQRVGGVTDEKIVTDFREFSNSFNDLTAHFNEVALDEGVQHNDIVLIGNEALKVKNFLTAQLKRLGEKKDEKLTRKQVK
tara:strand:+ start:15836 stop:16723 length:888 start_codon:yes stop_codon:yes gene_type:complete